MSLMRCALCGHEVHLEDPADVAACFSCLEAAGLPSSGEGLIEHLAKPQYPDCTLCLHSCYQGHECRPCKVCKRGEPVCAHETQALSEPSLTLHCTACPAWLKMLPDGSVVAVHRGAATRGTHVCPRCAEEWVGDSDYCDNCEAPTWLD